jgi:type I restriction enzyme M protein
MESRKVLRGGITMDNGKEEYFLNSQCYIDIGTKDEIKLEEVILSINSGVIIKSTELNQFSSIDETNYKYLMLENINDIIIGFHLPNLIKIDDQYKEYCVKDNSLVISKLAPFRVGMVHLKEEEEILIIGNLYFIEIDESKVNPFFVEAFLQSEKGICQLNKNAKGSAIKNISIQDLKGIQIPNLSREKQEEVAEEFKNLCVNLNLLHLEEDVINYMKRTIFEERI